MSMISYEVLPGGALLERYMGEVSDRSVEMEPAYEGVIDLWREITASRFASNADGEWPPLADATVNATGLWARDNQNYDQILRNTMVLFDSLMGSGTNAVDVITPEGALWGTDAAYAHWHQNGGDRLHASGAGWPPQRKIVDLTPAEIEESVGILWRHLFLGVWQ